MSKLQKRYLMIGLLLIALAALFPPKVYLPGSGARGFLYARVFGGYPFTIDFVKLVTEWVFLAALTGFLMLLDVGLFFWTYEARHPTDIQTHKNESDNNPASQDTGD